MEASEAESEGRPGTAIVDRVAAAITDVEHIDDGRLRLVVAVVLSGAAVVFFRQYALQTLGTTLAGGVAVIAVLYLGFHRVGIRRFGRIWPGASRSLAVALLVGCLCPPDLPLPLTAALGAGAVLVEGLQRRMVVPVALGGVLVAWVVAWVWRNQFGLPLLAPFQLRPLDEPIILWTRFQLQVDPVRLYTGNVAGPLGATSFGLAALGFLVLAYARRASWAYLVGLSIPPIVVLAAARQPLTIYLLCGQAMVLGGIVAAESRRLPFLWQWRFGAGLIAGGVSAALLLRGLGGVAFGAGIVAAAATLSAFQLFGLTGTPGAVPAVPERRPAAVSQRLTVRLALLVLVAPLGLYELWRDETVPNPQRVTMVVLGAVLYVAALAGSMTWLWLLRVPA